MISEEIQNVHGVLATLNRHDGVRLQLVSLVQILDVAEETLVELHVHLGVKSGTEDDRCARDHDAEVLALANDLLQ